MHPVRATGSVQWPTRTPSMSVRLMRADATAPPLVDGADGADGAGAAAEFGGDCGGDQLARGGLFIQPFEQAVHPVGDGRSAGLRELTGLADVRDWKDAGHDFCTDPGGGGGITEAEEDFGRKEELRDCTRRPCVKLTLQIVDVCCW